MFLRRILPVLVALILGYTLGYLDAFRGPDSLGWKFGDMVDGAQPDAVRRAREKNAERIREKQREGIPAVPE